MVPVKKNDRENEKIPILRVFQDVLNEDPRAAPVAFAIFRLLTLRRGIAVVRQIIPKELIPFSGRGGRTGKSAVIFGIA